MELRCQRKGSVSYGLGADFSLPHCLVGDKVSESSAEPSPAGISELRAENRHGSTLRQSVQRYRCRFYFSLFSAGKSPEDIVGQEAFYLCPLSCPCQIVDGNCVQFIAFKPILHIKPWKI